MPHRKIHPVILSGGVGSRLWPLSRALYPKQLLALTGERTLLQQTARRLAAPDRFEPPVIIGNDEHRFIIAEQLEAMDIAPAAIVLEPEGRNTAPAAALAAIMLLKDDPEAMMLIAPSDHLVANEAAFGRALAQARAAAQGGKLVTFGIKPSRPATGYGYIDAGEPIEGNSGCLKVNRFVEKPDRETAAEYVKSGHFFWNSGIFLFPAAVYLDELEKSEPAIVARCREAIDSTRPDLAFTRPGEAAFLQSPANSIDYAVMEKTVNAVVVPIDMGWSDVGSWAALWEVSERNAAGNSIKGDVLSVGTRDSLLRSEGPTIAAVGLRDMIVVATKDAVLVAEKSHAEDVRKLVDQLADKGREEHLSHLIVYRPWGSFETIDHGERFKVKRIVVKPGEQLSLQKHHHRAEHWVVVQGTALVTCGEETVLLEENQSTFIPLGTRHRLENPGKIPLHLIEVQSGSYLGEDDIVRFDDTYGRD